MPVCVVGMHRSGTSMVTRLLNICGLYLGEDKDLMQSAVDNPEGFWENLRFTKINDDLLSYIGGGWDYFPTDVLDGWEKDPNLALLSKKASDLMGEFSGFDPWGWKDPRTSLTLPFWKSISPDLISVVCLRNPLEVALSLKKRGGSSVNFGLYLWLTYNKKLLSSLQPDEYIVAHYDAFFENPKNELERLLDFGNVSAAPDVVKLACSSISLSLHRNRMSFEDLNQINSPYKMEVIETYASLCRLAGLDLSASSFQIRKIENPMHIHSDNQINEKDNFRRTMKKLIDERKDLSDKVAKMEGDLKARNVQIDNLYNVIEEIHHSTSWRITKPVRVVSDLLRAIVKKVFYFMIYVCRNMPLSLRQRYMCESFLLKTLGSIFTPLPYIHFQEFKRTMLVFEEKINDFDRVKESEYAERLISAFPDSLQSDPTVTIIIPVFNQIKYTVRCLLSIAELNDKTSYEIIVTDDGSTDQTQFVIESCRYIRYIRNEENLGFLKSCNKAASMARGKYILLLNNDTFVLPNWLDSLLRTFDEFPQAGLVGSKLINPDITLQEAGGIIWKDGDGWNYGRGDNPDKPQYNYLREVDYCSGASIIIPKVVWNIMEGFDEIFIPAYYEDTDMAFRIRQAGYKVLYQPKSQIIHFEGVSSGKDVNKGIKKYQVVNKEKFISRWAGVLIKHGTSIDNEEAFFRNRYAKGRILFIDAVTPTPDQDSGSIDAINYMRIFKKLGFEITFLPSANLMYHKNYTDDLQQKGIECQYYPYIFSGEKYVEEAGRFDIVFLSRFPVARQYMDIVRSKIPGAKVVFNTVDLHFLREERLAYLQGENNISIQEMRSLEIDLMRKSDHTILVSESELDLINSLDPSIQASVVPIPRDIPGRKGSFETRRDILFIGGYSHIPNIDAVHYFVNEIWPLISKQLPGVNFVIAGSNMPKEFDLYRDDESIILRGFVEDLPDLFNNCRLSVAPLRYGAGIKGKIVTSLSHGVPCVASPMAIEGMGLELDKHILCAATPEEFANSVVKLYTSSEIWYKLSENGLDLVRQKYSLDVVEDKLLALINNLLHK